MSQYSGYFEAMRRSHPVKVGDTINGKRVVMTYWQWTPGLGDVPLVVFAKPKVADVQAETKGEK